MSLPIPIYKGWSWWALSRAAIETVFTTIEQQPDLAARYEGTLSPDESIFQTIVVNAPALATQNSSLHYADWRLANASPQVLGLEDLPAIQHSKLWFARKIDASEDGGLRDALDRLNLPATGE